MKEKISKVISVFKKDGFKIAVSKVVRYIKTMFKKHMGLAYRMDFSKNKKHYEELIDNALNSGFDRILIWRSSFGWNVPLFQRPQHISLNLSKKRCLVFYEVTSMTDDVKAIEKLSDNLYLVNFNNKKITELLLSRTDSSDKPKYLQFYSTDWTMKLSYVKEFISKGYKLLYEYIDDINPQLAGTKELPVNIKDKYDFAMTDTDNVYVVVTADLLRDDVVNKRGDKNLAFSTNGVDYDFFKDLSKPIEFEAEFSEIISGSKTTVGYYGAMAKWVDYDLIKAINDTNEYSVVLFGIRYDDSLDASGILSLPNVHFLGSKDYKVLKYYASKIDVLTIPFVINDITKATSPLKLFEYMALEKPIVTTAMNECMKYETPMIAHSHEQFIELLDKAKQLSSDTAYIAKLNDEAMVNSWSAKADAIIELLKRGE